MASNYVLLEKIVVGAAGASSVTFSNIPQTGYTDLLVKFSARGDAGAISRSVGLTFNGSSTGYSNRFLQGDGSAASSGNGTSIYLGECTAATATASTFGNQEVYIPNYTSSNNKSLSVDSVAETNATTQYISLVANLWANSAAITSMTLSIATGNFVQGSTFYLYGIAKLGSNPKIAPFATGGDFIMTDGSYWYHAFRSSGTFRPVKALSVDYLVVAGGAGGNSFGAGGGAGGLRSTLTSTGGGGTVESRLSVAKDTNYTVTIGAGGSEGTISSPWTSSNGSNSTFATITSVGGGGVIAGDGQSGGSGGGGVFAGLGGAGTANQGFAGGNGSEVSPTYRGGGGGGSGVAGSHGDNGGYGGNGLLLNAFATVTGTGVSGYYAGGGGGGSWYNNTGSTGGLGGGGIGAPPSGVGGTGVANTGSGGGGGGSTTGSSGALRHGGAGGSGIVIVRYSV